MPWIKWAQALVVLGGIGVCFGQNLGTMGQVYRIDETDLLHFLETRLRTLKDNGQLEGLQRRWQARTKGHAIRPSAVLGLHETTSPRRWRMDPSYIAPRTLRAPNGKRIVLAGARINPLDLVSLKTPLVFFDGEAKAQLAWLAKKCEKWEREHKGVKLIAVNGSIEKLTAQFHRAIYFDQNGRLTRHFKLQQVPAVVRQRERWLEIAEVEVGNEKS